jgi:SPP1 gp7 family putative phage head morphogenesis protein
MRIDLAGLIRRAGVTRQRQFIARPIEPTGAQRGVLLNIYMRVVREWGRLAQAQVMPVYERTVAAMMRDSADDVQGEMDTAAAALHRLVLTLNANLEDWVVRVEEWHRGRFGTAFTATGVNLETLLGRGDVTDTLRAVLAENAALIRALDDQLRAGISGEVFRGLSNRLPAAEVARGIRAQTGIARRRAELIAADQLQKLTGRLDQERQEQVGIEEFEWAHSRKRYPRKEHIERDGKKFRWDSRVARDDPPGRAIRCGCRARAVVTID